MGNEHQPFPLPPWIPASPHDQNAANGEQQQLPLPPWRANPQDQSAANEEQQQLPLPLWRPIPQHQSAAKEGQHPLPPLPWRPANPQDQTPTKEEQQQLSHSLWTPDPPYHANMAFQQQQHAFPSWPQAVSSGVNIDYEQQLLLPSVTPSIPQNYDMSCQHQQQGARWMPPKQLLPGKTLPTVEEVSRADRPPRTSCCFRETLCH